MLCVLQKLFAYSHPFPVCAFNMSTGSFKNTKAQEATISFSISSPRAGLRQHSWSQTFLRWGWRKMYFWVESVCITGGAESSFVIPKERASQTVLEWRQHLSIFHNTIYKEYCLIRILAAPPLMLMEGAAQLGWLKGPLVFEMMRFVSDNSSFCGCNLEIVPLACAFKLPAGTFAVVQLAGFHFILPLHVGSGFQIRYRRNNTEFSICLWKMGQFAKGANFTPRCFSTHEKWRDQEEVKMLQSHYWANLILFHCGSCRGSHRWTAERRLGSSLK